MGMSMITSPQTTTPPTSEGTMTLPPSTAAETRMTSFVPQNVTPSMAPTTSPMDWLMNELNHLNSEPTRAAWFTMEFSTNGDGTMSRAHKWGVNDHTLGGTGIEKTAAGVESGYEYNPITAAWEASDALAAQDKMGKQIGFLTGLDKSLAPLLEAWNIDKYSPNVLNSLQGDRQTFTDPAGGKGTVLKHTISTTGVEDMWSVLMPELRPGGCLVPSVLSGLPAIFSALSAPSGTAVSSAPSQFAPTATPTIAAAA